MSALAVAASARVAARPIMIRDTPSQLTQFAEHFSLLQFVTIRPRNVHNVAAEAQVADERREFGTCWNLGVLLEGIRLGLSQSGFQRQTTAASPPAERRSTPTDLHCRLARNATSCAKRIT